MSRSRLGTPLLMLAAVVLAGCTPTEPRCADVPMTPTAIERSADARAALDFDPMLPCSTVRGLGVSSVTLDTPAGAPRITYVVGDGVTLFLLSQARAVTPFQQIPEGTARIDWQVEGIPVAGFEGTTGSGAAILYVQWESGGIVYELQAMPAGRLTPPAARTLARATVTRSATWDGGEE
ncbi:MAG: hypothetical protein CVU47_02310 [Chloroflexi bacterium HGW-Chloroflexi-9]|nr:MAG: hypothetical protein CVU47_02310 [Chloroflexi bacterium HGW-Chloroflexi-9]